MTSEELGLGLGTEAVGEEAESFAALRARAGVGGAGGSGGGGGAIGELKRRLPALWVVMVECGVGLEEKEDGRWVGACPFHEDDRPSFAVFWREGDKVPPEGRGPSGVGCWVGCVGGDVLDFLRRWHGVDLRGALRIGRELAERVPEEWTQRLPGSGGVGAGRREGSSVARLESLAPWVEACQKRAEAGGWQAVERFLRDKGLSARASWVGSRFRLGEDEDGRLVCAYYRPGTGARDAEGVVDREALIGAKTRVRGRGWLAARGSRLEELWGVWRDPGGVRVVICEGESDVVAVTWEIERGMIAGEGSGEEAIALGLPAGAAGPRAEWVARLAGRDVTLLLDADEAGSRATRRWVAGLEGVARSVQVARPDEGQDACSTPDLRAVLREALAVRKASGDLVATADGYMRPGSGRGSGGVLVTGWTLRPVKTLLRNGAVAAWDVIVSGGGEGGTGGAGAGEGRETLTIEDMVSEKSLVRWANARGLSWRGSSRDAQSLLEILVEEGVYCERGWLTGLLGLAPDGSGTWVLPGESIGARAWSWEAGPGGAWLGDRVWMGRSGGEGGGGRGGEEEKDRQRAGMLALLKLHRRDVVCTVLAWLAAAPLRGAVRRFPALGVTGPAGHGKTTLLEACLGFWGWGTRAGLGDTTPYAVWALLGSSCGVPIWFDEYRGSARAQTKVVVDNAIRAGWDKTVAIKGGLDKGDLSRLTELRVEAPLVVSGEESFSEVSLRERMALVEVPRSGQSEDALRAVMAGSGVGRRYLEWLMERWSVGDLPGRNLEKDGGEDAAGREAVVRGTLVWGWELLGEFGREVLGLRSGWEGELVLPERGAGWAGEADPYLQAIEWGLEHKDRERRELAWIGDDRLGGGEIGLWIRSRELVNEYLRAFGDGALPGGSAQSFNAWVRARWKSTLKYVATPSDPEIALMSEDMRAQKRVKVNLVRPVPQEVLDMMTGETDEEA